MTRCDRVVYSISVEDLQHVAQEELGRSLSPKELKAVEEKLGDYVDWYGAVNAAIQEILCRNSRPGS